MRELTGNTVRRVEVVEGEDAIRFICDGGAVIFEVDGDCCSESWFADIVGVEALIDGTVAAVHEIELKELVEPPNDVPHTDRLTAEGRSRQEENTLYGYVFVTDKGRCTVAFRNSSNGYYGGDCRYLSREPKRWSGRKWRMITEDWSA